MKDIHEHREWDLYQVKQTLKAMKWVRDTLFEAIYAVSRERMRRKVGLRVTIWTYLEKKGGKDAKTN